MRGKIGFLLAVAFLFAVFCSPSVYAQTLINFDDASSGTVINNRYAGQGAIFSCTGTGCSGDVYVGSQPTYATSDPNTVGISSSGGSFSESSGIIRVDFSCNVERVTLQAIPNNGSDPAWLRAYDIGGAEVDSDLTSGTSGSGNPEQLEVNAQDIAYIRFSGEDGQTVYFDDLFFECSSIPTLSQLGMIVLSLLMAATAFRFIRRRKRTV
jgi:hypothetical protein